MYPLAIMQLTFNDEDRYFENKARPLDMTIWYPAKLNTYLQKIEFDIWKIKDAAPEAPILSNNQTLPLIVFSHGYSGNVWVSSWLAEYLAERGFIVACVNHYGNNVGNMIPALSARPWHRPQDMSKVLTYLLKHPFFCQSIDEKKIGTAGFSQGGMTSLWLGGAQANLSLKNLQDHLNRMNNPPYRIHFKELASIREDFTEQDCQAANRSYRDERVKAVFAMAPAINNENEGMTQKGISKVCVPTHIVIGQTDPLLENARFFADSIPFSEFTLLPGKVTHMTFLNEGKQDLGYIKSDYIKDDPSINRADIHNKVGALAFDFFNRVL